MGNEQRSYSNHANQRLTDPCLIYNFFIDICFTKIYTVGMQFVQMILSSSVKMGISIY